MATKTLLVTGGCGFIGSNFVRYVFEEHKDLRIINFDALTYAGNLDNLDDLKDLRYEFVHGDITSVSDVAAVMKRAQLVVHFAAESHVDRSIESPEVFTRTNTLGTQVLLDQARAHSIERFVHVSTDEVYGSLGKEGYFFEESPLAANSPYSASKAGSDLLVRAYYHTFGFPGIITRCSNNYGPYQFPEKLIPLIVLNALEGKPLPVYGDGKNVRDWLYVEDHCEAIWSIMNSGRTGETYNVGGNAEIENILIVQMICDILDEIKPATDGKPRRKLITFVQDRPGHDRRYAIDFAKLNAELGWSPRESFKSGLSKTVEWYLNQKKWVENIKTGAYQSWIKEQYGS